MGSVARAANHHIQQFGCASTTILTLVVSGGEFLSRSLRDQRRDMVADAIPSPAARTEADSAGIGAGTGVIGARRLSRSMQRRRAGGPKARGRDAMGCGVAWRSDWVAAKPEREAASFCASGFPSCGAGDVRRSVRSSSPPGGGAVRPLPCPRRQSSSPKQRVPGLRPRWQSAVRQPARCHPRSS